MSIRLPNLLRSRVLSDNIIPLVLCHRAEEFLDERDESHPRWEKDSWIFRGQNDASWPLIPPAMRSPIIDNYVSDKFDAFYAFYRDRFRVEETILEQARKDLQHLKQIESRFVVRDPDFSFDQFAANKVAGMKRYMDRNKETIQRKVMTTMLHSAIEQHLVQTFSEVSDRIGLRVPGNRGGSKWDKPYAYYETLHDDERNPVDLEEKESDRIIYALAQHHGMPTRLLDWTYSPTTAAFFAAFSRTILEVDKFRRCNREVPPVPQNIIVWAFKQKAIYYTSLRVIKHFRSDIGFLGSQDGLFLYDMLANEGYHWNGHWVPFETRFAELEVQNQAYRIVLPFSQSERVLEILQRKRVSKPFLMPSFDNVANEIIQERIRHTDVLDIHV